MGNYTRIKFSSRLRDDTPADAVDLLFAVAAGDWPRAQAIAPQHEFFKTEGWQALLRGAQFKPMWPEADGRLAIVRHADGSFHLAFHSSLRNYDDEIDKFLAWISPTLASAPGAVVGEYQSEWDHEVTLLIAQPGRIDQLFDGATTEDPAGVGLWPPTSR